MNAKFSEDFLLTTETGKNIYNKYTAGMPVINYYSKMKAKIICENLQFADVAELFICQDEERQNIMRSFRIDEKFITGDASNYEKFQAFAEIMPDLAGTTIFLRTALELKRLFNIDEMLCKENARQIFEYTGKIRAEKNIKCPTDRRRTEKIGCMKRKNHKMSNRQEKDRKNWMFRAEKPSNVQCMTISYEIICL